MTHGGAGAGGRRARAWALATSSSIVLGLAAAGAAGGGALAQEGAEAERIVVTGSRIVRRDFEANSPIVTVESDTFENRSSFNVEAALNQLPQFAPDGTSSIASGASTPFAGPASAPGAATLDLRGLGANRSLVLVNGRRPQPVNAQLIVDVNSIPSAAIENVEVITGGAAAVYGADAIAGVVNFKLRQNFEGLEVDGQYGISERGDNEETQISALIGGDFADDRGNAMVGAVWSQRGETFLRDRSFYARGWRDPGTDGGGIQNAVPGLTQVVTDPVSGATLGVNPDGSLFDPLHALDPAAPYKGALNDQAEGAGFKINQFGVLQYNDPLGQLTIPSTRYSIFGNAHYDITDNLTAFLEAGFTENFTSAQSLVPPAFNIWAITIPYNQANDDPRSPTFGADPTNWHPVSPGLADFLNSRGPTGATDSWQMSRALDFLGRLRTDTTSDIYQITAGLDGQLPYKDWTWEVYGSHGKTNVLASQPQGSISQENLTRIISGQRTVLSAFTPSQTATGPWGQGWSTGEVLAVAGTCESGIPIFNPDGSVPERVQVSQDCIDYATLELTNTTQLEQNIVEGSVQGGLFDLSWSDEVRFALGATYRSEDFLFTPDSGNSAEQARANVINLIALPLRTEGFIDVTEVFGELLVPLLVDKPYAKRLDLELGYRYGDYNVTGGIDTYKALADWTVNDWIRLRGGYQRANRAPNIYELFAPITSSIAAAADPCANVTSLDGGPDATPLYGNRPDNPNRANVQLACSELIARDGGFRYKTILDDPNPGDPPDSPTIDFTHISNFRWSVSGYDQVFAFTLALQQGNPNLESEVADTWTLGAVLRAPFPHPLLDRLTMSVDWYQIEIEGTIATPGATTVYSQCLDPQFNPLIADPAGSHTGAELLAGSPYCALINREPVSASFPPVLGAVSSGLPRNYDAAFVNLGGTRTSGVDIQVNWAADLADLGVEAVPGGVSLQFLASILDKYEESPFPGGDFVDYTGTLQGPGYYDYRLFATLGYELGRGSVGLRWRFWPGIDAAPGLAAGTRGASSHSEADVFGRWAVNETVELRGGIDNVLDERPEVVGASPTNRALNTTSQNYDPLGRRYYVGATLRF